MWKNKQEPDLNSDALIGVRHSRIKEEVLALLRQVELSQQGCPAQAVSKEAHFSPLLVPVPLINPWLYFSPGTALMGVALGRGLDGCLAIHGTSPIQPGYFWRHQTGLGFHSAPEASLWFQERFLSPDLLFCNCRNLFPVEHHPRQGTVGSPWMTPKTLLGEKKHRITDSMEILKEGGKHIPSRGLG